MALPKATAVAQYLAVDSLDNTPVRLRTAIATSLQKRTALSAEVIAEHAEAIERHVLVELYRMAAEDRERGADPAFSIDARDSEPYVRGLDGPIGPIREQLFRLNPTEFEHVCLGLLRHLGADGEVTGGTNDGGVDFRATGLRFGAPHIAPVSAGLVSVLGQSKRYAVDNIILLNELRQFVGAVTLRVNELRKTEWRFAPLSPVVFAFWTTSDFHESAVRYARDLGLWILNGRALAQLIRESNYSLPIVVTAPRYTAT